MKNKKKYGFKCPLFKKLSKTYIPVKCQDGFTISRIHIHNINHD